VAQESVHTRDIGVIHRAKKGELLSGDEYLIHDLGEKLFVAVIDGLGHGPKAHEAAVTIKSVFKEQIEKGNLALPMLFDLAHKRAAATRGGVVGAALVDYTRKRISFLGVGNISMKCIGKNGNESPVSVDGIVGYTMDRKNFKTSRSKRDKFLSCIRTASRNATERRLSEITPAFPCKNWSKKLWMASAGPIGTM